MHIESNNQTMIRSTKPATPAEQALDVARKAMADYRVKVFAHGHFQAFIELRDALQRIEILLENDNDNNNKKGD